MCQYQLSSDMLPSEAPMPPCAATVCERVGKTLDSTATFRPARDSCSEARMPEPPAPTMTTSNLRLETWVMVCLFSVVEPGDHRRHRTWTAQPVQPASQTRGKTCSARRRPTGLME